jgi:ATP-binding cassette subfamily F protein uup
MTLLSFQNVSLAFGKPLLFENTDLEVKEGERLCLVGRNGAGKSTLLKLINAEIAPDSGQIFRRPGLRVSALSQEIPAHMRGKLLDVISPGVMGSSAQDSTPPWEIQTRVEKLFLNSGFPPMLFSKPFPPE